MGRLVDDLIRNGYLRTNNVIDAFLAIPREEFVQNDLKKNADSNIALPIGHGQTISQPMVVAFMLELLDVQKGQHILDVGSGSGWTTALLANIVGKNGKVIAIEILKDLFEKGKYNVEKLDFIKNGIVDFYCQSAENGFEKNAPYDRILVSASANKIPDSFKQQLAIGGKMVLPINDEIWFVEKRTENDFEIKKFPGFVFVPFVKNS
ncbi:MAG: hypothetical protein UR99_C0010G0005 [Candidatus Moranbacteria bacterium GW2011_GWD2_36_12]|nr:MAG: hypothetical protein UR99_C0010G0005 [Candidatus Moranbacteria bacterium GW2011_GWD2_36_12]KKQ06686.1 MAG: hypothetical protein US16_C0011G0005 [Candidatus Moranbacteria bacterium GW2011_GWE2_36_40]